MRLLIVVNYRARGSETYAARMRRRLRGAESEVFAQLPDMDSDP